VSTINCTSIPKLGRNIWYNWMSAGWITIRVIMRALPWLASFFWSSRTTCAVWGCKNRLAPFPGQMLYKTTKPGSLCMSLSLGFFWCMCCAVNYGLFLGCYFNVIYEFCRLVDLVRLSVPVQVIDWKDSFPKWPIMCWWGR